MTQTSTSPMCRLWRTSSEGWMKASPAQDSRQLQTPLKVRVCCNLGTGGGIIVYYYHCKSLANDVQRSTWEAMIFLTMFVIVWGYWGHCWQFSFCIFALSLLSTFSIFFCLLVTFTVSILRFYGLFSCLCDGVYVKWASCVSIAISLSFNFLCVFDLTADIAGGDNYIEDEQGVRGPMTEEEKQAQVKRSECVHGVCWVHRIYEMPDIASQTLC